MPQKSKRKSTLASQTIGTTAYINWKASKQELPKKWAYEVPLYADVHLGGIDTDGLGPYKISNAFSSTDYQEQAIPRLYLIVEFYLDDSHIPKLGSTDTSRYHGGDLADEISALLSLSNGIRLKAGHIVRHFGLMDDPYGQPQTPHPRQIPSIPSGKRHQSFGEKMAPLLPFTRISRGIDTRLLREYHLLQPSETVVLTRAARFYQEAVWIADVAPELSWLMLTSAVEVAAQHWRGDNRDEIPGLGDAELLQAIFPRIVKYLEAEPGGQARIEKIASEVADFIGATKKFCGFILHFCPSPPSERTTAPHLLIDWSSAGIKTAMTKIYKLRSDALHGGIPFPPLMCESPYIYKFEGRELIAERPISQGMASIHGSWGPEETPMMLHTFEYIARMALIRWWRAMIPSDGQSSPSISSAADTDVASGSGLRPMEEE